MGATSIDVTPKKSVALTGVGLASFKSEGMSQFAMTRTRYDRARFATRLKMRSRFRA